jgi:hypothetical protein
VSHDLPILVLVIYLLVADRREQLAEAKARAAERVPVIRAPPPSRRGRVGFDTGDFTAPRSDPPPTTLE